MKKILALCMVALLLSVIGACSNDKAASNGEEAKQAENKTDDNQKAVKSALLTYQNDVMKEIRTMEAAFTDEEKDLNEALAQFGNNVSEIALPKELSAQKTELEAATGKLKEYYTNKINGESANTEQTDALKQEYIDQITKVFEDAKAIPPSFDGVFQ
ncbi:hypothetical protein CVD25_07955 [Bacillus canaveralius]|uniref:Lipoprotein n=1 Tax=Bacillus canaveralius TaxID=1403243 RepID=A0A2N5GIM0_9BACI|nr:MULTISPECIES: hypothetical protein [Bacillus]PLR80829.1 hypothetical protein CU635_17425 [Bacillus canaveralius]PLR81937.1 hypothetical protein CVD23_17690 [Bacillus sp. V33-4]PLR98295.1 hypothetical protein CVD25_07955 [Bacillus canaveralius]RSK51641.1 hypothetical protein EJA13_14105 [Bacillus canaveralius]